MEANSLRRDVVDVVFQQDQVDFVVSAGELRSQRQQRFFGSAARQVGHDECEFQDAARGGR
jgi:hypothetical protein